MSKKRDTRTYDLKNGRRTVYRGSTNDLERREREHRIEGKKFTHLVPTSRKMTEEGARKKETRDIERYKRNHSGRNPKYNKDNDG